jgi:hypothetical protein
MENPRQSKQDTSHERIFRRSLLHDDDEDTGNGNEPHPKERIAEPPHHHHHHHHHHQHQTCSVLFLDRLDDALLRSSSEQVYQDMILILKDVNQKTMASNNPDEDRETAQRFDPILRPKSVIFGNYKAGWGFTLDYFAGIYAFKFGIPQDKMMQKMWGDWYFCASRNDWTTLNKRGALQHSFCQLILNCIQELCRVALDYPSQKSKLDKMLRAINVLLPSKATWHDGSSLKEMILKSWLPLINTTVSDMNHGNDDNSGDDNQVHGDDATVATTTSTEHGVWDQPSSGGLSRSGKRSSRWTRWFK